MVMSVLIYCSPYLGIIQIQQREGVPQNTSAYCFLFALNRLPLLPRLVSAIIKTHKLSHLYL